MNRPNKILFTEGKAFIEKYLVDREGELNLGQKMFKNDNAKFVILGIEESIGPVANLGKSGSENAFKAFLKKFLSMQSNATLVGNEIGILGKISINNKSVEDKLSVEELDSFVFDILKSHVSMDQIPIVIGGGHNNSYPIIKAISNLKNSKLDIINLDAHADYRKLEHRHSGNPFSYAFQEGLINRYFVMGLHERYNNEYSLKSLDRDRHYFTFFEEYLDEKRSFINDINEIFGELNERNIPFGLELDLDAIENMPSSANSPSGFNFGDARKYVRIFARNINCSYLHLPEGSPKTPLEENVVGKALSYLVSDFISIHSGLKN